MFNLSLYNCFKRDRLADPQPQPEIALLISSERDRPLALDDRPFPNSTPAIAPFPLSPKYDRTVHFIWLGVLAATHKPHGLRFANSLNKIDAILLYRSGDNRPCFTQLFLYRLSMIWLESDQHPDFCRDGENLLAVGRNSQKRLSH